MVLTYCLGTTWQFERLFGVLLRTPHGEGKAAREAG